MAARELAAHVHRSAQQPERLSVAERPPCAHGCSLQEAADVEKLDYLVWGTTDDLGALLDLPSVRGLTVQRAADVPKAPILLGRGPELGLLVQVWLTSYDDREPVE